MRASGAGNVTGLRDRPGAVELDDRVGREGGELVVVGGDAVPAGMRCGGRSRVLDGDRPLQHAATGRPEAQRPGCQPGGLFDRLPVRERAILVVEQDEGACGVDARVASSVVGEQQRVQAESLGLVGHQLGDDRGQPDRFRAQRPAHVRVAGARCVALGEHEVDDVERGRQALGQRVVGRKPEGDACGADLGLRPHEALGHGGLGTRNACATSAVDRPPRSRRVSATCASGASAG
jgi:hypothetical protein